MGAATARGSPGASGRHGPGARRRADRRRTGLLLDTRRWRPRGHPVYSDHRGNPQEFISAAKYGYLFQGQHYAWQKQARGARTDGIAPVQFVNFIESHDQLANSADGSRLHQRVEPGMYRAMTALLLLSPGTPMLFQGQEFGASSRFLYFADHEGELAEAVRKGRAAFVTQFPSLAMPEAQAHLPDPANPVTFHECKLRWEEYEANCGHRRLYEDLLALRRSDEAFRRQEAGSVDGAVLDDSAFVLRFLAAEPDDERLLVVNFGCDLRAAAFPEPLIAPPERRTWSMRWSSESIAYGGFGAYDIVMDGHWRVPGRSATVLAPTERHDGGTG